MAEALAAARTDKSDRYVEDEVDVLLITAPQDAKRRAREWAKAIVREELLVGSEVIYLKHFLDKGALDVSEVAAALQALVERDANPHTFRSIRTWTLERYAEFRTKIPLVDELLRTTLAEALTEAGWLAKRELVHFKGFTVEERAEFVKSISAEPPITRAFLLSKLAVSQPTDDSSSLLVEDAKRSVMELQKPSHRVRCLLTLTHTKDADLRRWAATEAIQAATASISARNELGSSLIDLAEHVPAAWLKTQLSKLLSVARTIDDTPQQWMLRLGVAGHATDQVVDVAREARAAFETADTSTHSSTTALEVFADYLPPRERREAFDFVLEQKIEGFTGVDPRDVEYEQKQLELAAIVGLIPAEQVRQIELETTFSMWRRTQLERSEAVQARKFYRHLRRWPGSRWFNSFEAALRRSSAESGDWSEYWLTLAYVGPSWWSRLRSLMTAWNYLMDGGDARGAPHYRAQELLTLAAVAPAPWSRSIRRDAWRLVLQDENRVSDSRTTQFISQNVSTLPASMIELVVSALHLGLSGDDGSESKAHRTAMSVAAIRIARVIGPEKGSSLRRRAAENTSPEVQAELLAGKGTDQAEPAAVISLIKAVAQLPRPQALTLLARASMALIKVVAPTEARAALDDIVDVWP